MLGTRFYDPEAGVFNRRDSAKDGLSYYAYTSGNVMTAVDPWGTQIADRIIQPLIPIIEKEAGPAVQVIGTILAYLISQSKELQDALAEGADTIISKLSEIGKRISAKMRELLGDGTCTTPELHDPHRYFEKSKPDTMRKSKKCKCYRYHVQMTCYSKSLPELKLNFVVGLSKCYEQRGGKAGKTYTPARKYDPMILLGEDTVIYNP